MKKDDLTEIQKKILESVKEIFLTTHAKSPDQPCFKWVELIQICKHTGLNRKVVNEILFQLKALKIFTTKCLVNHTYVCCDIPGFQQHTTLPDLYSKT